MPGISIPTDTMEQEFQKHYDRGHEKGQADGYEKGLKIGRLQALKEAKANAFHDGNDKPKKDGVYQVLSPKSGRYVFSMFLGQTWHSVKAEATEAFSANFPSTFQFYQWRELPEEFVATLDRLTEIDAEFKKLREKLKAGFPKLGELP